MRLEIGDAVVRWIAENESERDYFNSKNRSHPKDTEDRDLQLKIESTANGLLSLVHGEEAVGTVHCNRRSSGAHKAGVGHGSPGSRVDVLLSEFRNTGSSLLTDAYDALPIVASWAGWLAVSNVA